MHERDAHYDRGRRERGDYSGSGEEETGVPFATEVKKVHRVERITILPGKMAADDRVP